jgi:hypothetical protein
MTTARRTAISRSRVDTVVLARCRKERLRQVAARPLATSIPTAYVPTAYVPRHRADLPIDPAA